MKYMGSQSQQVIDYSFTNDYDRSDMENQRGVDLRSSLDSITYLSNADNSSMFLPVDSINDGSVSSFEPMPVPVATIDVSTVPNTNMDVLTSVVRSDADIQVGEFADYSTNKVEPIKFKSSYFILLVALIGGIYLLTKKKKSRY